MRLQLLVAGCVVSVSMLPGIVEAQWRQGQPDVVVPPPAPKAVVKDSAAAFRARYAAANKPGIVLFWNIKFDDQTATASQDVEVQHKARDRDYGSLTETTQGPAGAATLTEGDERVDETITRTKHKEVLNSSASKTNLSARNSAELESAFREEMRRGGVNLLDRATIMRASQVKKYSGGADAPLIEADAVMSRASLLLEIIMIPDPDAPIQWGFQVSVKDVKKGTEVASFYTVATPRVASAPGRYVATEKGYEWSQPQATAGVQDVGVALATAVMEQLGNRL